MYNIYLIIRSLNKDQQVIHKCKVRQFMSISSYLNGLPIFMLNHTMDKMQKPFNANDL